MRVSNLAKPGPIIIATWFICYLIWAFFLPYEWIRAVRKFLFEEHLDLQVIKSLGLRAVASFWSLSIEFQIVGIFLLVALAIGVVLGLNWFKERRLAYSENRRAPRR
jgi:hypothetical protein